MVHWMPGGKDGRNSKGGCGQSLKYPRPLSKVASSKMSLGFCRIRHSSLDVYSRLVLRLCIASNSRRQIIPKSLSRDNRCKSWGHSEKTSRSTADLKLSLLLKLSKLLFPSVSILGDRSRCKDPVLRWAECVAKNQSQPFHYQFSCLRWKQPLRQSFNVPASFDSSLLQGCFPIFLLISSLRLLHAD